MREEGRRVGWEEREGQKVGEGTGGERRKIGRGGDSEGRKGVGDHQSGSDLRVDWEQVVKAMWYMYAMKTMTNPLLPVGVRTDTEDNVSSGGPSPQ